MRRSWPLGFAVPLALAAALAAAALSQAAGSRTSAEPLAECSRSPVPWRPSRALGATNAGRLVDGVRLPAQGPDHFSWDAILGRVPDRGWRRWGTFSTVERTLGLICRFRIANPDAPRIGIGDLSRRRGGDFGPRFGGLGHASHQNGLDVDVYYPRSDRLERGAVRPAQADFALAQGLLNRFVKAGAEHVFIGEHTPLRGRAGVVMPWPHHDDHMHVRWPR